MLLDVMKWQHLPVQGALFDQDPEFVEHFRYYVQVKNEAERKRQEEERRKNKPPSKAKNARRGGRR